MAHVDEKENIADGLVASTSFKAPSPSPKKSAPKKKRAKSIGPGGVEKEEEARLKASNGNRRKVCIPFVEYSRSRVNWAVCFCTGCQVNPVVKCRRREEAQRGPSQIARYAGMAPCTRKARLTCTNS